MIVCKNCGCEMIGDGYTQVIHCENSDYDSYFDKEPDSSFVYCEFNPLKQEEE